MPWNGAGSFSISNAHFPEAPGNLVDATRYNAALNDLATGIANCLAKDGQNVATGNIPMGGFRLTGLGEGTGGGQALTWNQTSNAAFGGFVGIGTGAPNVALHLHSAAGGGDVPRMQFTNGSTGAGAGNGAFLGLSNSNNLDLWNYSAAPVRIGTNNLLRLSVDPNGNVGIGTASPTSKLAVVGDIRTLSGGAFILNNPANAAAGSIQFDASDALVFYRGGSVESLRLDNAGRAGLPTAGARLAVGNAPGTGTGIIYAFKTGASDVPVEASTNTVSTGFGTNGSASTNAWGAPSNSSYLGNQSTWPLVLTVNATAVMTLAPGGNVGIGTASPAVRLHVVSPGSTGARIETGSVFSAISFVPNTGNSGVEAGANGTSFYIGTGGAERLKVETGGNVVIGASYASQAKLTVIGSLALGAPVVVGSGTYTVGVNDVALRFNVACTVTLPAAASFIGRILKLVTTGANAITSASANVVPLNGTAAGTAILAATAGKCIELQSDGTNWYAIGGN